MQLQLDQGDYIIDNHIEKTLLDKLHKKLLNELCAMDIDMDDFQLNAWTHVCTDQSA